MRHFLKGLLSITLTTFVFTALFIQPVWAQTGTYTGKIIDGKNQQPFPGVRVLLKTLPDTTQVLGAVTDASGNFSINNVIQGNYLLRITFLGYAPVEQRLQLSSPASYNAGNITLEPSATLLKAAEARALQIRQEQKGDTTELNAGAFKVNPDANAEDLITKMPGITVENGVVKAQGEEVKKVLVDGKEFFGDDAGAALKNLPAEVVDKIQVFDRASDQSQFTRFDDGNSQKTLNIVTKPGKNQGNFGKVYAGYGTDNRYNAGLVYNQFQGHRRISVLGMANNINQQNFSFQDILGATGASGGGRGGPGRGGMMMGGSAGNFMVGQQNGISSTQAAGINYSDKWGKKINVSASYFFNRSDNSNDRFASRNYFNEGQEAQTYQESQNSDNLNMNHRFNARLEYTPDTMNSLIFSPRFSFQDNDSRNIIEGLNRLGTALQSSTNSENGVRNTGYNLAGNLNYRHRFRKAGRSVSLALSADYSDKDANSSLLSTNEFYGLFPQTAILDQLGTQQTLGNNYSADLSYTEPLGKNGLLQFSYNPSYVINNSDKETNSKDPLSLEYSLLDSAISSAFENTYQAHKGGLQYQYNHKVASFTLGMNYQLAYLEGIQSFPVGNKVSREFQNWLPNANLRLTFSKTTFLRIFYRTGTDAPSVNQLQELIDNRNPLQLSTGNSRLEQSYSHRVFSRFGTGNTAKSQNFFIFAMGSYTSNYIGNSLTIATRDTVLEQGVVLNRGAQLTRPVNLNGYYNARSFLTYGQPLKKLKSNLNLNAGFSFTRTPGLINEALNLANTYNMNAGFVLGSNISEKLDFTLTFSGNYNIVENTLRPEQDNNYYNQLSTFKINWMPHKRWVFNTDLTHTLYSGLGASFSQNFLLWNAAVGYKFLKNNAGELRLSVFDLLNQNTSVSRNVAETYVEDVQTQVLQRYAMLTFIYNFRKFKGNGADPSQSTQEDKPMIILPPGGPGGGGPPHGMPPR